MYEDVSLYILILVQLTFPYKIAEDVRSVDLFPTGLLFLEAQFVLSWYMMNVVLEFEFDYVLFKAWICKQSFPHTAICRIGAVDRLGFHFNVWYILLTFFNGQSVSHFIFFIIIGVSITALWPATAINSHVTRVLGVESKLMREPEIFADACVAIAKESTDRYCMGSIQYKSANWYVPL